MTELAKFRSSLRHKMRGCSSKYIGVSVNEYCRYRYNVIRDIADISISVSDASLVKLQKTTVFVFIKIHFMLH